MAKPILAPKTSLPKVAPPPPLHYTPPGAIAGVRPGTPGYEDATYPTTVTTGSSAGQPAPGAAPAPGASAPSGGGSGGDTGGDTGPPIDWAQVYFGNYGLPSDLISQIEALGKQYGTTNPDVFMQSAQNLIRGSDWFKTTYPGFAAGVTAGLYTDETGYRGYLNQLNQVYQQYLGRSVSGTETAAALAGGASPTLIANQFQGDTIANVNANQWNYVTGAFDAAGPLTAAERTAAGREQAGIDTPLGQMVQQRLQQAQQRLQTIFGGSLANPSLSLANGRLAAPGLAAGRGTGANADVGA